MQVVISLVQKKWCKIVTVTSKISDWNEKQKSVFGQLLGEKESSFLMVGGGYHKKW